MAAADCAGMKEFTVDVIECYNRGGGDKMRILDSGPEHLESGSLGL